MTVFVCKTDGAVIDNDILRRNKLSFETKAPKFLLHLDYSSILPFSQQLFLNGLFLARNPHRSTMKLVWSNCVNEHVTCVTGSAWDASAFIKDKTYPHSRAPRFLDFLTLARTEQIDGKTPDCALWFCDVAPSDTRSAAIAAQSFSASGCRALILNVGSRIQTPNQTIPYLAEIANIPCVTLSLDEVPFTGHDLPHIVMAYAMNNISATAHAEKNILTPSGKAVWAQIKPHCPSF